MNPVRFLYLFPLFLLISPSASYAAQTKVQQAPFSAEQASKAKSYSKHTNSDTEERDILYDVNMIPVTLYLSIMPVAKSSTTTKSAAQETSGGKNDFFSQAFLDSLSKEQAAYLARWKKGVESIAATISKESSKAERQRYQDLLQTYRALCYLVTKQYATARTLFTAASIHLDEAKKLRAYCYIYGMGTEKDHGIVREILDKCFAYQTNPINTLSELAYLYENIKLGC